MKKENPVYQRILEFLETQPCPRSTNYIAGEGIWPDQYFHKFKNAIVVPGKNAVNSAYYYLKNLEKQGKVKQVYKGAWSIVKNTNL